MPQNCVIVHINPFLLDTIKSIGKNSNLWHFYMLKEIREFVDIFQPWKLACGQKSTFSMSDSAILKEPVHSEMKICDKMNIVPFVFIFFKSVSHKCLNLIRERGSTFPSLYWLVASAQTRNGIIDKCLLFLSLLSLVH